MASLSFKSCFSSIDRICLLFVSFASFRGKRRRRTAPNKFVITRSNCTTACCLFQCFAFSCCVRKASDQLSIDVQSRTREILFPFARPVIFCIRTTPKSKFKGERKAFFFALQRLSLALSIRSMCHNPSTFPSRNISPSSFFLSDIFTHLDLSKELNLSLLSVTPEKARTVRTACPSQKDQLAVIDDNGDVSTFNGGRKCKALGVRREKEP